MPTPPDTNNPTPAPTAPLSNESSTPAVTIYSTPTCHFCHMAKEFLTEHKVTFVDHDVAEDAAKREEMREITGQMGVPVIIIGNDVVVGFDEDKIRSLLNITN